MVLAEVAPYLVRLPQQARLLRSLVLEGWGRHWGIYLTCSLPLQELRRHLRRFLMVEDTEGREVYLRFYDPRVLRTLLLACTPVQARELFGEISAFLVEGEDPAVLVRYERSASGGVRRTHLHPEKG